MNVNMLLIHSFLILSLNHLKFIAAVACGISYSSTSDRIIGGRVALRAEYPWMVSIQRKNTPILYNLGITSHRDGYTHFCGGALIASDWVITAAHCFDESLALDEVRVIAGGYSLSKKAEEETIHEVEHVEKHPEWNSEKVLNDIALVKLKNAVNLQFPWTNVICLPNRWYIPFGFATIAGWGLTSINGKNSDQLLSLDLPIIGKRRCEKIYGSKMIKENMICAGYLKGGKDSCNTDSGGPMMKRIGQQFFIIGIISFGAGEGCAKAASITVTTKVSNYVPWIQMIVSSYGKEQSTEKFDKNV
ncbi:Trypsin-1-like protein [Dinothrombium tinctorium]|uniref:limulus clotting factor C n=1 Tax=Dinothrombium tinctorium TaxID=1965070 RepID=A0A3S3NHF3_9ACAR|nr:Trypsin-1-like protein [Dinothrombium tinctorium]